MALRSYHPDFDVLLGDDPIIELLLETAAPLAHEAGVFFAETNELYVTSNRLFDKDSNQRVQISRIQLDKPVTLTSVDCSEIVMGNGGIKYKDGILFCAQGNQASPSGIYYFSLDRSQPATLLISGFFDRPFSSLNDVVVHSDGSIWFTDPPYGHEQGYRPPPRLPAQVYRLQPSDNSIRAIADGFGHPNGICFSPDEKTVYVTDTDWVNGNGTTDDTKASSIYAFDICFYSQQPFMVNRRLFAMCDVGIPDGIKCDMEGNVYSGCGDGVNVWSAGGTLLGKILIEGGVSNFCFGEGPILYLLNETKLWSITVGSHVRVMMLLEQNVTVNLAIRQSRAQHLTSGKSIEEVVFVIHGPNPAIIASIRPTRHAAMDMGKHSKF